MQESERQIATALAVWQVELDQLSTDARQLRQAMIAFADGTGPSPEQHIRNIEIRRSRADALCRDLLKAIQAHRGTADS
jgi:hypothetical protein